MLLLIKKKNKNQLIIKYNIIYYLFDVKSYFRKTVTNVTYAFIYQARLVRLKSSVEEQQF